MLSLACATIKLHVALKKINKKIHCLISSPLLDPYSVQILCSLRRIAHGNTSVKAIGISPMLTKIYFIQWQSIMIRLPTSRKVDATYAPETALNVHVTFMVSLLRVRSMKTKRTFKVKFLPLLRHRDSFTNTFHPNICDHTGERRLSWQRLASGRSNLRL